MIQINDSFDRFAMGVKTGKLKGRTRIILENIDSRRREVYEDTNMMTDAIKAMFNSNYYGSMDYFRLMQNGVKDLLGGIMLFQDPLTEEASNIFPPSQAENKLIAHAGQTPIPTTSRSTRRGNPVGHASVVDPENGLVKFVWDWSLDSGNGNINSLGLTNAIGGDFALFPEETDAIWGSYGLMIIEKTLVSYNGSGHNWNEGRVKKCPIELDSEGNGISVFVSGNTFTENTVRHPFTYPELIETPSPFSDSQFRTLATRTATLTRTFTANYTCIAHDKDYFYVMERDSANTRSIHVNTIDRDTFEVEEVTVTITGPELARPQLNNTKMLSGIVSNGNIYWPNSTQRSFIRIKMNNPADVEELETNMTVNIDLGDTPVVLNNGLVTGRNFLINGSSVYRIARRSFDRTRIISTVDNESGTDGMDIIAQNSSPLLLQTAFTSDDATYYRIGTGGVLFRPYLASVNNLANEIQKTANKTMRVEYTIAETD